MDSEATCRIKAGTGPFPAVVLGLCFMGNKMLLGSRRSLDGGGRWGLEGRKEPAGPGPNPASLWGGEREPGKTRAWEAKERRKDPCDRVQKGLAVHALEKERVQTTSHGIRTRKAAQGLLLHVLPGEGRGDWAQLGTPPGRLGGVRCDGRGERKCGSAPDRFQQHLWARGPRS